MAAKRAYWANPENLKAYSDKYEKEQVAARATAAAASRMQQEDGCSLALMLGPSPAQFQIDDLQTSPSPSSSGEQALATAYLQEHTQTAPDRAKEAHNVLVRHQRLPCLSPAQVGLLTPLARRHMERLQLEQMQIDAHEMELCQEKEERIRARDRAVQSQRLDIERVREQRIAAQEAEIQKQIKEEMVKKQQAEEAASRLATGDVGEVCSSTRQPSVAAQTTRCAPRVTARRLSTGCADGPQSGSVAGDDLNSCGRRDCDGRHWHEPWRQTVRTGAGDRARTGGRHSSASPHFENPSAH